MPWTDKLNSPLNTVKMHIGHTSSPRSHRLTRMQLQSLLSPILCVSQLNLTALAPIRPYQSVYKEIKGIL